MRACKRTCEVSFSIVYDLCVLKNEGKMTDFKMNIFKTEVKNIYVHSMQPLISSFTCSAHFWFLWKMVGQPFQKLVDGKLVASSCSRWYKERILKVHIRCCQRK